MIGNRLKLARSAAGFSLRGLEAQIGSRVTAQAIGKYERNESMPGSGALLALARSLDVSADYLLGDPDLVLEGVEFRKKSITRKKEKARIQAQALDLMERYLTVEDILGFRAADWDKPRSAPYPVRELADAESAARGLREYWDLGIDPIPNLTELLEERGIKLLFTDLRNIDGVSASVRSRQGCSIPVIVISGSSHAERERFTLAHELAHLVLSVATGLDEEKAAHRFAGAFLMPREALWANAGKHRSSVSWGELFSLKKLYGASVQAIVYRCRDVGIFPESLFRRLYREISAKGWRRPPYEPFGIDPERPARFERLCFRALAEGAISESKAAELLGITVNELNRRVEEPAPAAHE